MFFKLDNITGRVAPSATAKAYNPAGLTASGSPKEPVFMFESSKIKPATVDVFAHGDSKSFSTAGKSQGVIPSNAAYGKVAALQKKWAVDDGLLVWQKKGFRDSGPYYGTLLGIAVGAAYSFYLIYKMSFPKKLE